MKEILTTTQCRAILFSVASLTAWSALAEDSAVDNWQVRFSANTLFNVSAGFQGHPKNMSLSSPNDQPGAANYDNGYVGLDISGDPHLSTYWGYTQSSQQITSGGNVTGLRYDRTAPLANSSSPNLDSDPSVGGDIDLRRELTTFGKVRFGLDLGVAYNHVHMIDSSSYWAGAQRTSDIYNLPSPVNSALFPPPGYQGPYNGAGPVIDPTVAGQSSAAVPNAVFVSGRRDVEANIFGFRLGPYLELPLSERFSADVSAGLLVALVQNKVNWSESLSVNTATANGYWSGQSSASANFWDVSAGFYAGANLSYQLSRHWSVFTGARFQDAGALSHSVGDGRVQLDLGKTVSVNLGIGCSF